MTSIKFYRVTRKHPCVICGKPDFCGISPDGLTAVCMRIPEGRARPSRNGGSTFRLCSICQQWGACGVGKKGEVAFCLNVASDRQSKTGSYVHPLDGPSAPQSQAPPQRAAPTKCVRLRASVDQCDQVYTCLLEQLSLLGHHGNNLLARDFCDVGIARELFASVPGRAEAVRLTLGLAREFDLSGVPGFYRDGPSWCLVMLPPGILIPSRDHRGRIQALRIRLDKPRGPQRYIWVSSVNRLEGASPGAPMHFARPWRVDATSHLIITEGELKAGIAAQFLDTALIGLPGVTSFKESIGADLRNIFPPIKKVRIAFDCDATTNPWVKSAELRLARALSSAGLAVTRLSWPEHIDGNRLKGIDDFVSYSYAK